MSMVLWRTRRSRVLCSMSTACCAFVFTATKRMVGPAIPYLTGVYGGGLALVEKLAAAVEAHGGRIIYETTAVDLIRDEEDEIAGARVVGPDGRSRRLRSAAVVLASGGFEGNSEMMARYLRPASRYYRPISRGGYYNKGEGICMALSAGAAPAGDYTASHHEPIDPRSDLPEAMVTAFPLGIMVNADGERFIDEASPDIAYFQEEPCKAIARQPGGIGYFIYDAKIDKVPHWRTLIRSMHPPIEAPKLSELAEMIGVPADALDRMVKAYNAACVDGPVSVSSFDGRATNGVTPPKSNFAHDLAGTVRVLPRDRRHHLHARWTQGHQGRPGRRLRRKADEGPVRRRRDRWHHLRALSRPDRCPKGMGLRPAGRLTRRFRGALGPRLRIEGRVVIRNPHPASEKAGRFA